MDMGEKIYMLRTARGMTLEQLGDAVGVGKSTVRKWENGMIANMRRDKIAKIAAALHVSPAYLMGWDEDPTGSGSAANYRQIDQASNTNDPSSLSSGTASETLPGINLASTLHQPYNNLSKAEQQLLGDFRELNSEGQEKVCEYASDLAASGRYIKARSETA